MLAHVQAGSRDLERAAEALAYPSTRAAGRSRPARVQLPLGLGPGRPRRLPRPGPRPLGAGRREPGEATAGGVDAQRLRGRRRRARCSRAPPPLEERVRADLNRPTHDGPATDDRPIAYFSAEYGFHGSFPIYSGGLGALAGDILKEASDRAWPLTAIGPLYRNGYFRQRIDSHGWQHEYWVDTDPDRLPAALVTGDDGKPITVERHGRRRSTSSPRSGAPTSAACRSSCSTPTARRTPRRRAGSPAASTSATRTRASPSTCCSASAASARWRRWGSSRASCTSTRATRRSSRSSSPAASTAATARSPRRWRSPASAPIFTTHTPVPAGNDTYPAHQVEGRSSTSRARSGSTPAEIISLGRTNPDGGGRAVRRHPVRAADVARRQRRVPAPRRGRPRDVAPDVARQAPSTTSRSPT